jgi:hypothetical protein
MFSSILSSFEVSPARDELEPVIILHHEFSQHSWPSCRRSIFESASLLVGSNQLPVISVTIIPELNIVYTSSFMLSRAALWLST